MTSVVRYVKNTIPTGKNSIAINSTGNDYQFIPLDIITVDGILANANVTLPWTGAGEIKSIISFFVKDSNGKIYVPLVSDKQTSATADSTGKIITIAVPTGGTAIVANSIISMLLVIGNY